MSLLYHHWHGLARPSSSPQSRSTTRTSHLPPRRPSDCTVLFSSFAVCTVHTCQSSLRGCKRQVSASTLLWLLSPSSVCPLEPATTSTRRLSPLATLPTSPDGRLGSLSSSLSSLQCGRSVSHVQLKLRGIDLSGSFDCAVSISEEAANASIAVP